MKIATAPTRNSKHWQTAETTWNQILAHLRQPKRTGETAAEYRRMSRDEQAARKDVGGFVGGALDGGRRRAGAVTERWLITLDQDNGDRDEWDEVTALYPWAMAEYSTHSHLPEKPRLRWVIPLSRAVTPDEYGAVARKVAWCIDSNAMDPTTYQPERLMYWPSCPDDAAYVFHEQGGPLLDPDEVLRTYGTGDAWRDVGAWPLGASEKEIVVREAKKQGDPTQKPGIVGKWCRCYDVENVIAKFLPDVYEKCDIGADRYTYTAGSSSGGAVLYEGGAFLYSYHATDPAGGKLLNAFDLVRIHKFGALDEGQGEQEVTRLPSYKAMCDFASKDEGFRVAQVNERLADIEADLGDLGAVRPNGEHTDVKDAPAEVSESDARAVPPDEAWKKQFTVNRKTGDVEPTIMNALLILQNDPLLRGKIAKNEFLTRIVVRGPVPWRRVVKDRLNGEPWSDTDDAGLLLYLENRWNLNAEQKTRYAMTNAAEENTYHPVREYLDSLQWDGEERLDTMLVRWMGAEDIPYTRAVTRKWMTAGVARIYEPGRKFDQMLMLVGPQGAGKSKLAMALAKGIWFNDSLGGTEGKDAYEGLQGKWIIEFAELAATKKSEVESVKNFITKQEDTYRAAYARNPETRPRQCIFLGTTNDMEFLRDRTGNRRFWPVEVTGFDNGQLRGFEDEVDMLWAEAREAYRAGETLWLSDASLQSAARAEQERFAEQDELVGLVEAYLDILLPESWESLDQLSRRDYIQGGTQSIGHAGVLRRNVVSLAEIRNEMLRQDSTDVMRGNAQETRHLASIMNTMPGWHKEPKRKRLKCYGQQWVYRRIDANADYEPNPSAVQ